MLYKLSEISSIPFDFRGVKIIFLKGDVGAGKTTLSQHILRNYFGVGESITSPTYTYYNKYSENLYHFDLYRIGHYDEFFAIGGEEILDSDAVCLIEWPDLIAPYYEPDLIIYIEKTELEDERDIKLMYKK